MAQPMGLSNEKTVSSETPPPGLDQYGWRSCTEALVAQTPAADLTLLKPGTGSAEGALTSNGRAPPASTIANTQAANATTRS